MSFSCLLWVIYLESRRSRILGGGKAGEGGKHGRGKHKVAPGRISQFEYRLNSSVIVSNCRFPIFRDFQLIETDFSKFQKTIIFSKFYSMQQNSQKFSKNCENI